VTSQVSYHLRNIKYSLFLITFYKNIFNNVKNIYKIVYFQLFTLEMEGKSLFSCLYIFPSFGYVKQPENLQNCVKYAYYA